MAERPLTIVRLCALALVLATLGCSPLPANQSDSADGVTLDAICVRSLQRLDDLIAARVAAGQTATETIIEARALRATAAELYVDGDNDMALELIDEAFVLLGIRK